MKEPVVSRVLRFILYVIFGVGALITVTLPWMLETYTGIFYDAYYLQPGYRQFILSFLIIVAFFGLWIISELIRLLRSIPEDPFVMENVRILRRIGFLAYLLSVLFFLKCFFYVTFLTMFSGILFAVGGLAVFTLCNLFRQAVIYKEENDMTI